MNLTETYRSRLAELFPFWAALSAEQQERLKNALQVKCVGKNELVAIESRCKDGLLLVLEGRLRVYISAENGREISILFLTRGDPFSIITVDNAGPFDIVPQLQATERTVLAYIPKADFVSVAYCVPQASEYLLNVAARNAQGILNCIEKHLFSSLRHGVARIILEQAERDKSDSIHITHEQIANHLGTTREVVSREVEQLRYAGIISTARGRIGILDRARLSILGVMRTSSAKQ
ncbi:MAG: Crp/Fnr family transcriptional regulator [Candidatus Limivicinus sp.]|nr:Crp/Fnr family transcriptional regulator [Candidatus Limivicinus sp.]